MSKDFPAEAARELADALCLEGFRLSKALLENASVIAKIHVDTWRSQYTGIVLQEYLDNLSYEKREAMWSRLLASPEPRWHLFVLKNSDNEVIGFSCGGKNRSESMPSEGEVYAIYLTPKYQGRGLGKKLMMKSLLQLQRDGFKSCLLWVLENNPSRAFYEAVGGKASGEKMAEIGGIQYKEILYSWPDLDAVIPLTFE